MTGPTHKQYAVTFALATNTLLYACGMTEVNYYLSLPIVLLTSKYGALFPDVDHTWQNVKDKTIPNWIINKIIHITGGKHRSWQTHSIDIVAIVVLMSYILPKLLFQYGFITSVNMEVMSIIMFGFSSGWISHIFADMLTSAGVRLICWLPFKVALVPKKLFKLKFNTGNEWEAFCFRLTRVINIILGVGCILYPIIETGAITSLVDYIISLIN